MTNETKKYTQATGRHKEAIARVRLINGTGKYIINDKLTELKDEKILTPLKVAGLMGKYDISVHVLGGGVVGQSKAIILGIARAIVKIDESARTSLKKLGLLSRDSRVRERKKYGLKSARRSPQWSKR